VFYYSEYWLGGPSQHISTGSHWRRWEAFLWASVHLLSKVCRSKQQESMLLPSRYLNLRHLTSDCPFSGYLPALVVSLILLWLPNLFFMLGTASSLLQLSNVLISFLISLQLASPQHLDSNASHSLQIVCTSRQFCIALEYIISSRKCLFRVLFDISPWSHQVFQRRPGWVHQTTCQRNNRAERIPYEFDYPCDGSRNDASATPVEVIDQASCDQTPNQLERTK